MRKLTYVNSLGEELVITNSFPFLLIGFSESENVNIHTGNGMNQDGLRYLGNTMDVKDITIDVVVVAEYESELSTYRDKIRKVVNPKIGEGYLIYTDDLNTRKIKCIVNSLPVFNPISGTYSKNGKAMACPISLTANNPYWTDITELKEEIVSWIGDFSFQLELVAGGIELGHRSKSLIVNVANRGDVESGMRIEFKAIASVSYPSLVNINTGEFIKINKNMVAGEVINVTTYFGNKKLTSILDGVETNIFNCIDFKSTFLQLDIGDNLFKYDALTGLDNLEVSIYYTPMYLGV